MSFRNSVTIVASPRQRVGKTLLARLLTDFHAQEGREIMAFDLNAGEETLAQFAPGRTTVASIADTAGQMALFDRLIAPDGVTKVVDLGHHWFEPFLTLAGQIDFAAEARQRGIAPALLFFATPDATSVDAYRDLRTRFPAFSLTPVHNEMLGPAPYHGKYPVGTGALLRLPVLGASLRRHVARAPFSFSDEGLAAAAIPPNGVLELRQWLRGVYREFRELDLRVLLADLQASLRLPQ